MQRRDFLIRSAGAACLAAVPTALVAAPRLDLLDDPQAWIGARFRTSSGATLELSAVEAVRVEDHSMQFRLHFRTVSGDMPNDGIHELTCEGAGRSLFLQPGRLGPVACVNRLRGVA